MGVLVVDVQGRNDSFADVRVGHRPSATVDFLSLRLKINCTCSGSAQIDILADDLLEKAAPAHCLVPDLSEGKLRLQYG